jgi:signal transduction histidine kinase
LCDFKGDVIAANESGVASYHDAALLNELIRSERPVARLIHESNSKLLICHPVIYQAVGSAEGFLALEIPLEDLFFKAEVALDPIENGVQLLSGGNTAWLLGKAEGSKLAHELKLPFPLSQIKFSLMLWTRESHVMGWFTGIFAAITILSLYLAGRYAYRISGQLTSSLISLETAASEIAESGTPQGEVVCQTNDEVGRLASSFNAMIRRLKESYSILETKVAERTCDLARLNRELESMVAERTSELERSNSELAGFCYAISHELRAPVARLQGFSDVLMDEDSEENRRFCAERVAAASRQLQVVIDAILLLSRLSKIEMELSEINLSELTQSIVAELQSEGEGAKASVAIDAGMSCFGDRGLLRICLVNLIGNAFKYSSREEAPHVEIGMATKNDKPCFYVSDNGAGFDMQCIDMLFVPFQRLHQQDEFPGTGIGLATVQRIVERHGGSIWAEGKEGEGATFFFTVNVYGKD